MDKLLKKAVGQASTSKEASEVDVFTNAAEAPKSDTVEKLPEKKTAKQRIKSLNSGMLKTKLKVMSSWYEDRFIDKELLERFTKQQLLDYKEAYKMFDRDSNGVISVGEVITVLRSLGQDPNEDQVEQLFARYDQDGSGNIEFPEFIKLISKIQDSEEKEEDLVDVFRVLDQDGDGVITKADLRAIVVSTGSSLTNQDIEEMIEEGDKDGDGTIEFEEFVKLVLAKN